MRCVGEREVVKLDILKWSRKWRWWHSYSLHSLHYERNLPGNDSFPVYSLMYMAGVQDANCRTFHTDCGLVLAAVCAQECQTFTDCTFHCSSCTCFWIGGYTVALNECPLPASSGRNVIFRCCVRVQTRLCFQPSNEVLCGYCQEKPDVHFSFKQCSRKGLHILSSLTSQTTYGPNCLTFASMGRPSPCVLLGPLCCVTGE